MNYIITGFIAGAFVALFTVLTVYFLACAAKRKIRKETYLTKKEIAEMENASFELKRLGNIENVDVECVTKALDRIVYESDLKEVII